MSLELMQMRMNSIADKLDIITDNHLWERMQIDNTEENHLRRDMLLRISLVVEDIANIIREEMKIEHY